MTERNAPKEVTPGDPCGMPENQDNKEYIDRVVRRKVGIAALRHIRKLVDTENESDQFAARRARQLGWLFAALALLFVLYLVRILS